MEWSTQSEFNSFNSWKGLLYAPQYEAIMRREFPPPIEASLDLIHSCNLSCAFCNAERYLDNRDYEMKMRRMPYLHSLKLIDFLAEWGVKGCCYGGGGEPTLHTGLANVLKHTRYLGMDASVITNGALWSDDLINTMAETCQWVGVSVDAATRRTYEEGKGTDYFGIVTTNMTNLVDLDSKCEVGYKFLIFSFNQHEIYDACTLAKSIGVRDFHARPADFEHQGVKVPKEFNLNRDLILEQFEKCHELEDDNFRVFTIMHKFNKHIKPIKDFSQCYAAPLAIQICADGGVYFCLDQRHQSQYFLGYHYPDPSNILNFWGHEHHQHLVFGNTPQLCTTRCTYGIYCRQCEQLFTGKDPMCRNFP